jgi:hypothetical protein
MATYKCKICGISKDDTITSQLNTSVTCKTSENNVEVAFHDWEMVSVEDLVFN